MLLFVTVQALQQLTKSENKKLRQVSTSALWEIQDRSAEDDGGVDDRADKGEQHDAAANNDRESDPSGASPRKDGNESKPEGPGTRNQEKQHEANKAEAANVGEHVMISYNWDHQDLALKIRDYLESRGFKVWIDIAKMGTEFS